jgi:hypothetical protein
MKQSEIISIIKNTPTLTKKFEKKYCGDFLGKGIHRDVYTFKQDDRFVVKLERDFSKNSLVFSNIGEWRNWCEHLYYTKVSSFLAPCLTINNSGQILIQRRVTREIDGDKRTPPKYLPNLLTDTKLFNFGWIDDKFVCVDYSTMIRTDLKMKKARYW